MHQDKKFLYTSNLTPLLYFMACPQANGKIVFKDKFDVYENLENNIKYKQIKHKLET